MEAERRLAVLEIPNSAFIKLFTPSEEWIHCVLGLPADAKLLWVNHDDLRGVWQVGTESADYAIVLEGCVPPTLPPPMFATWRAGEDHHGSS